MKLILKTHIKTNDHILNSIIGNNDVGYETYQSDDLRHWMTNKWSVNICEKLLIPKSVILLDIWGVSSEI